MKPTPDTIKNVHIDNLGCNNSRAALSCDFDGARYHVWFTVNGSTFDAEDVLYKNCPLDMTPRDPGYYHARKLRTNSTFGALMLAAMLTVAHRDELYAKALADKESELKAQERERDELARVHRVKEAGPELLASLREMLRVSEAFDDGGNSVSAAARVSARAAIAKAEATP